MNDIFGRSNATMSERTPLLGPRAPGDIFGRYTNPSPAQLPVLTPQRTIQKPPGVVNDDIRKQVEDNMITPQYIIKNKPKVSVVRNFFRDNLAAIVTEEDKLFG
jgi:hypothetical protein